jgi:hypothetical protein
MNYSKTILLILIICSMPIQAMRKRSSSGKPFGPPPTFVYHPIATSAPSADYSAPKTLTQFPEEQQEHLRQRIRILNGYLRVNNLITAKLEAEKLIAQGLYLVDQIEKDIGTPAAASFIEWIRSRQSTPPAPVVPTPPVAPPTPVVPMHPIVHVAPRPAAPQAPSEPRQITPRTEAAPAPAFQQPPVPQARTKIPTAAIPAPATQPKQVPSEPAEQRHIKQPQVAAVPEKRCDRSSEDRAREQAIQQALDAAASSIKLERRKIDPDYLVTDSNPLANCDAVIKKINKIGMNLDDGKSPAELTASQQQVCAIGMNAHGHLVNIEKACAAAGHPATPAQTAFIDKIALVIMECMSVYNRISDIIQALALTPSNSSATAVAPAILAVPVPVTRVARPVPAAAAHAGGQAIPPVLDQARERLKLKGIRTIQTSYEVLHHNALYRVNSVRLGIGQKYFTKFEVEFIKTLNADELAMLGHIAQKKQPFQSMLVFAPQTSGALAAARPGDERQVPEQNVDAVQVAQAISEVLHGNEQVSNPLVSNIQFAREQMDKWDLINEITQAQIRENYLDLVFPSRTLFEGYQRASNELSGILQDGVDVDSTTLLHDRIDRLEAVVQSITNYAYALLKDFETIESFGIVIPNEEQERENAYAQTAFARDLLEKLTARYDEITAAHKANADAFMAHRQGMQLYEVIEELMDIQHEVSALQAELVLKAKKNLEHRKAVLEAIKNEMRMHREGFSMGKFTQSLWLLWKRAIRGYDSIMHDLDIAWQNAELHYLTALSKVDYLQHEIDKRNRIIEPLEDVLKVERAKLDQCLATGTLLEQMVTADLLEQQLELDAMKRMHMGRFITKGYRNRLGKALITRIYTPAYNTQLTALKANKLIISTPERETALDKALQEHSLARISYKSSPEFDSYLKAQGIVPSEFKVLIADPLRVRLFGEMLLPARMLQHVYENPTDDATRDKLSALVQTTHEGIEALHNGNIAQAATSIDAEQEVAKDLLRDHIFLSEPQQFDEKVVYDTV